MALMFGTQAWADALTEKVNGSSEYRVECASPIAPGSGVYNIYLHFEPGARRGDASTFMIGGADKGAWLVHKE